MFTLKSFVMAYGLAAVADAHMLLRLPAPYTSPAIQSSPLAADGSNFPCQSTGGPFQGTPTKMAKGSKQQLGFTGSAVHGGGSCQVSITYDKNPTKDSSFKVIHSIIGGCPARNTAGNLPPNPDGAAPDTYDFTIPDDIPSGEATLAWSWVNKIGNREFYMNCAPVTIDGEGGSESALAALPDMFVANIASQGTCATKEGVDTEYPNPGKSVEKAPGAALGPPVGECGASSGGGSGGSATASASPAGTPAARFRRAPLVV
ncbi:uncharacterized protein C8A04DRAFT_9230 [Dichotomopilus funicola]|uniref:Uncharacterized protein n=1 Tax=Dichotomopilus funicola TaxID=1934379 RepID=A0AAN6VA37_9PEZI|nr:hypothetical protein C8A04DRAFT_9230 [Dichotomopilus funicola]